MFYVGLRSLILTGSQKKWLVQSEISGSHGGENKNSHLILKKLLPFISLLIPSYERPYFNMPQAEFRLWVINYFYIFIIKCTAK
jgi:hypothetical protein